MSDQAEKEPNRNDSPPRFGTNQLSSSAYEAACLEAVRQILATPPSPDIVIDEIVLSGEYPRTRIVVPLLRRGKPEIVSWSLYEDVFSGTRHSDDPFEPAEGVAIGVYHDVLEG